MSTTLLKVGFYVGDVDLRGGGIAPYAQRVLRALTDFHFSSPVDICVVGGAASSGPTPRDSVHFPARLKRSRITRARHRVADVITVLQGDMPPRRDREYLVGHYLSGLGLDLLHVPYQVPPSYDLNIPFIVTMHDVQEIHFPGFFTAEERRDRAIRYLRSVREAAAVVVSFDHVKRDLIRYFGCDDDHVVVLPLPLEQCTLSAPTEADAKNFQRRYAPRGRFFLYPAQTWEHKNHIGLIRAFEIACQNSDAPISLICTGRKNDYFSQIEAHLRTSRVVDRVLFTGVVEEAELRWLYQECLGVVVPSLYEAGSFPLIEAMQLGAPVVCARTTSLPDTIGDLRFVFDPNDAEAMAAVMTRLAEDADYRSASIQNGKLRTEEMRSANIGACYEDLWRRVAGGRRRFSI